jgi:signal transduction histidine kinase
MSPIADTGCGIANAQVARVFEQFFTAKAEKRTGLGLWVVGGIVAKHDGSIKLRSSGHPSKTKMPTKHNILVPLPATLQLEFIWLPV